MSIRIVQSKQNARLKELRRALASPGRNENGLAGIEGPNLLAEAVRAGLHIACVFVAQGSERLVEALRLSERVEVLAMPRELLDAALSTETPQPLAALVEPPDWTWAHVVGDRKESAPLIVVLAGLQDPGNLGTIVRSAEAFGADGVVCLPGTVSAWNPKAVRASAGSVFRVPVVCANERDALDLLREAGVRILATTAQGAQPAELIALDEPVALVIGNEGNGVPVDLATKADGAVTIPCPGAVESLNAAVAASVLLYEAARQRAAKSGGPLERRGGSR
ncbi:MAG: RNA methyltransferase [Terracidiphilus sp.]